MSCLRPHLLALMSLAVLSVGCDRSEQSTQRAPFLDQSESAIGVVGPAWTARVGSSGVDQINAVALDSAGNVIVGGFAAAGLDGQTSAGGQDGLVTKYSGAGTKQWTRLVGTTATDAVNGVAIGSADSIYAAGYLRGPLDGQPNAGGLDMSVSKYDAAGNRLWTRTAGSTANDQANAVAVQGGGVYLAGLTGKSLTGSVAAGKNDIAIVRYDESGTITWAKSFGSAQDDAAAGVAVDASGNAYITGTTSGALGGNTALGGKDIFVVKLSSAGAIVWTKQIGTTLDDAGTSIVIGADGGIYVAGITAGALGGTQAGGTDAILLKLDSSGTIVWTKQLGGAAVDEGLGVAADSTAVFLTGRSLGQLPGSNSGGLLNMFAAKYALDGTLQTVREYSGGNSSGTTFSAGVAAANGRFVIAGGSSATGFDGVTGFGNTDGVLLSLCSDNNFACELNGNCTSNHGGCTASQTCTQDGVGEVLCGCGAGYTGSKVCSDVNECIVANGGCDALTTCSNTVGSRTCGACPAGYTGTGATGCVDVNECATSNGGCPVACTNTPGSFHCTCGAGYTGDGVSCTDIDECETNHGGCDPLTTCTNTPGSLSCGACPADYTGTGATGCICPAGYTGTGATGCTDIDECATDHGGCDPLSICTNTSGSFVCGGCPSGYSGSGDTSCVDVDECLTDHGGCSAFQTCTNTPGSRTCGCPAGFWDNGTACVALAAAWTARVGTSGVDQINAVAIDSTGNVIVGGFAAASLDGQTTAGGQDGLIRKYSSTGIRQWTRLVGTSPADAINGVAIGSADSIFAAGYLRGPLDGQPNLGGLDMSVSKYDAAGNRLWTRTAGSTANDQSNAVAVQGGGVYISGLTGKSLTGSAATGKNDVAVVRYDESGALSWATSFGSAQDDAANGIAVDISGSAYVAGTTSGALGGNPALGGKDIFIVKLSPVGSILWTKQFGTTLDDSGTGVAIGADGGIYVSGTTAGSLGGTQAGGTDAVLLKLDASGTILWAKQLGGAAVDEGLGVAADVASVFLTGRSQGQLPGSNAGGLLNMFAARYALDGSLLTVREYSGGNSTGTTFAAGVAAANGRFVIAGGSSATGFDGVTGFGGTDGVLMSLCSDHNFACQIAGTCTTNHGGCTSSQTCTQDGAGRVECGCGAGYTGSVLCGDVNECVIANGGCDALATCSNTVGSRTCGACPSGYTGNGATGCADVNECASGNGGCDVLANCTNTPGARTCSCPTGYTGAGTSTGSCFGSCAICDASATCSGAGQPDRPATCTCDDGYFISGGVCTACSTCAPGYFVVSACTATSDTVCDGGPGGHGNPCNPGYEDDGTGTGTCVDINECTRTTNGGCDMRTLCINKPGAFDCTACPPGYSGTGMTSCVPIDECHVNNGNCDSHVSCTPLVPGLRCASCESVGMVGNPYIPGGCTYPDPCATNNGGCGDGVTCYSHPNSPFRYCEDGCGPYKHHERPGTVEPIDCVLDDICSDSPGLCFQNQCTTDPEAELGYTCQPCPSGFEPGALDDGRSCADINECATNNGGCDPHTICSNAPGTYYCTPCPGGYVDRSPPGLLSRLCVAVDACATNHGGCDARVTCVNADWTTDHLFNFCGSCPAGYKGSGYLSLGGCTPS